MDNEPVFADPATQEAFERQKQVAGLLTLYDEVQSESTVSYGMIYNLELP